jgi:hypothetical protein
MQPDSKAAILREAFAELFAAIETEVVPTSVPAAANGFRVHFRHSDYWTYVPALNSWWRTSGVFLLFRFCGTVPDNVSAERTSERRRFGYCPPQPPHKGLCPDEAKRSATT